MANEAPAEVLSDLKAPLCSSLHSSLTLDKASEPKKRPVVIPHNLVSSFETALAGVGEVVSWLDWWLATLSKFGEALPEETRSDFQRMMVSGARSLEFLGSQTTPVLANLVLLRRDSLLSDVSSTVPAEELSRLCHAPLPPSSALFPPMLLDTALSKTRAVSNDALVHKALHPPRIPKRQQQQQSRASSASTAPADRSGVSPLVPRQRLPRQEATAIGPARAKSLFNTPRADPATQGAAVKAQASVRTDQVPTPIRVGGCLSLHWRQWQAIGANQWVVSVLRDGYRIPFRHQPPPPPHTHTH